MSKQETDIVMDSDLTAREDALRTEPGETGTGAQSAGHGEEATQAQTQTQAQAQAGTQAQTQAAAGAGATDVRQTSEWKQSPVGDWGSYNRALGVTDGGATATGAEAPGTVASNAAAASSPGGKAAAAGNAGLTLDLGEMPEVPGYVDSYAGAIERLEREARRYPDLSDEDVKKLRRRHRVQRITSAIADAGSAIANLVGTANYAPDMSIDPKNSLSARMQDRWDRERAEREKIAQRNLEFALKLGQLRDQQYGDKLKRHDALLKQREAMRKEALWPYQARTEEGKAAYWGIQADLKSRELMNKDTELGLKNDVLESQANKNNSVADKNNRTPAGGGKSGGGKSGGGKKGGKGDYVKIEETQVEGNNYTGKKTKKVTRNVPASEYNRENGGSSGGKYSNTNKLLQGIGKK